MAEVRRLLILVIINIIIIIKTESQLRPTSREQGRFQGGAGGRGPSEISRPLWPPKSSR